MKKNNPQPTKTTPAVKKTEPIYVYDKRIITKEQYEALQKQNEPINKFHTTIDRIIQEAGTTDTHEILRRYWEETHPGEPLDLVSPEELTGFFNGDGIKMKPADSVKNTPYGYLKNFSIQQTKTFLDDYYTSRTAMLSELNLFDAWEMKLSFPFNVIGTNSVVEIVNQLLNVYISSLDEGIWDDAEFCLKIDKAKKNQLTESSIVYLIEWEKTRNRFIREFIAAFCKPDGSIDWDKLFLVNNDMGK